MHLIISDLTLSSRQRLRQTWPSQLLDIWSGTTCWQIPKCRPGPTWSFWESILPDWNAVRSCPLSNTLLSQLWCAMIYASTNGHMDTWPPSYQKTKTFFVLSSVENDSWLYAVQRWGPNTSTGMEFLVAGTLDRDTRTLFFFRCGTESDSGCLQSKIFRYLLLLYMCLCCSVATTFGNEWKIFCFITLDATWDGYADIAMRQEGTLTGEHLPNKAVQLFSIGAFPFFVWHIIWNSLKLFPILSFPILSHDTPEDWEDHVEIACHKVTDLHRSNPARTQATENIPQTGEGVQGGHAADGNPDSVKVASQALVGWKFLQLMFFGCGFYWWYPYGTDLVLARTVAQVPTLFAMPKRRLRKQRMAVFL